MGKIKILINIRCKKITYIKTYYDVKLIFINPMYLNLT